MSSKNLKIPHDFNNTQKHIYIKVNDNIKEYCERTKYSIVSIREIIRNLIRYNVLDDYSFKNIENHIAYIKSFGVGVKLDTLKAKYGEKEGEKRWFSYCEKQSTTNSYEYKNKKYGMTKKEFNEYNKSRAVTLENQVKKHGLLLGTKKYNAYCKKQAYTNTVEYFIERYGVEKGIEVYNDICRRKGITLENMKRIYGDVEGLHKYTSYIENKNFSCYTSNEENVFISKLISQLPCSEHNYTQFGKMSNDGYYVYDFVNTEFRIAIEYNGSIWHGNPATYNDDDQPLLFVNNYMTAKELQEKDIQKQSYIVKCGVVDKCFVVWDSDNHEQKISEIIDYVRTRN